MTKVNQIQYGGWSTCYAMTNDVIELIITGEVGPRIIHFGLAGGRNEFYTDPATLGQTGGEEWRVYGGHRCWHAPEAMPRTYCPDNQPVTLEKQAGFVRVIQPMETATGIVKEIDLYLAEASAQVRVVHRLRNQGLWPVELAPWALTVMMPGGLAIIPLPPRGPHSQNLLPTNTLTLWAYTDMSDPRWTWGERYILLRQDSAASKSQKIGVDARDGWMAYAREDHLFLKLFTRFDRAVYPDLGCVVETFTNENILELETLGPVTRLEPGSSVERREDWFLYTGVPTPQNDADVAAYILPLVIQAQNDRIG